MNKRYYLECKTRIFSKAVENGGQAPQAPNSQKTMGVSNMIKEPIEDKKCCVCRAFLKDPIAVGNKRWLIYFCEKHYLSRVVIGSMIKEYGYELCKKHNVMLNFNLDKK